jgi:hypothetical protein
MLAFPELHKVIGKKLLDGNHMNWDFPRISRCDLAAAFKVPKGHV